MNTSRINLLRLSFWK